jgi:transposase
MQITTIGLDLAKQVFQAHGVDARGHTVLVKQIRRDQMPTFFANLPPCRVGMESCAGAHYWGRELTRLGHDVRLMAPQFVKPYVKSNKNDAADAQAICEAVGRPTMRYVAIKSVEQQAILSVHRARDGLVRARSALANQIRGLLAEFGLVMPIGVSTLRQRTPTLLDEARDRLPPPFVHLIEELLAHMGEQDRHIQAFERQIMQWHRTNPISLKLAQIPGIGPITASALVASVGDARLFKNGRQMAAWLGLVPRQHSSGGKPTLLGISKRGDGYLRKLLLLGAHSALLRIRKFGDGQSWANRLLRRRPVNVVATAVANKNARIA